MRRTDLTPLHRFAIGFDNIGRLLDSVSRADVGAPAYPPYNIEKLSDDSYGITMAVAGFAEDELDITVNDTSLVVSGSKETQDTETGREFLHRGIAARSFERRFELAPEVKVVGARLENGLLHVALERVIPEEKKPRRIAINSNEAGKPRKTIGTTKAAA